MKIAIFTESFLPGVGGTEKAVLQYATELSKTDEVLVVAPSYHKPCDDKAFPFSVVRERSIPVSPNDMWAMPDLTPKLRKTLDEFAPDVINCQHWGMSSGFANKYAKAHNIPLVYVVHTKFKYCYERYAFPPIPYLFIKNGVRRLKKADVVCTVSDSMIPELNSYGYNKPIKVIRNGTNIDAVTTEKPVKAASEPFTFLYVGLVASYKNIDFSLRALAEVKKTRSDFVFYVVGNGPDKKKLQKLSERLGLKDKVIFTGNITDKKDLAEKYAKADLLLFPSIFDNDSLVIIEAARNGVPSLVIKDSGSAERITDNENGFVSEYSVAAYADKILQIMNDIHRLDNMRKSVCSTVGNGWDKTVREYNKIYSELIAEKERAGAHKKAFRTKYKKRVVRSKI